jgi:hypothetical protein
MATFPRVPKAPGIPTLPVAPLFDRLIKLAVVRNIRLSEAVVEQGKRAFFERPVIARIEKAVDRS